MTAVLNPAAVTARAARMADRARTHAAIAAREAAERAADETTAPSSDWDTPVPYAPTPEAVSALSAASPNDTFDPDADDWRAILAPSLTTAISPVALHALSVAVKSATTPDVPVLEVARVVLSDGAVTIMSTDRYRVHRLTVPADGAAHAEGYVTPKDLAAVVRALAPAAARKGVEGTLALVRVTVDADEHTITWEGPDARHTTSWGDLMDYPPVERFLEPEDHRSPADAWHINPTYMGDALTAAAVAAGTNAPARVTADRPNDGHDQQPMVRVTAGELGSPTGRFDACIMSVRW